MRRSHIPRFWWNTKQVPEPFRSQCPSVNVTSALTFAQATNVHNTQTTNSCSFVGILSCAQRHRMLGYRTFGGKVKKFFSKGQPAKTIVDSFKKDVPTGFSRDENGEFNGADPYAFADYLFETVYRLPLVDDADVDFALRHAEKLPCVFSFLPVTKRGRVVFYTQEEFVEEFHDKYRLPQKTRIWHTQCIVGSAFDTATSERYFVCLQSWKGSLLTFIPAMSVEEILALSRIPENKKNLAIATVEELGLEKNHEVLVPHRLKKEHAPSEAEFTANKMSGMLLPPVHTGYFPKGIFT